MNNPDLLQRVETALAEIRPYLQNDGGDISLIGIEDDKIVKVKLLGSCISCSVNKEIIFLLMENCSLLGNMRSWTEHLQ